MERALAKPGIMVETLRVEPLPAPTAELPVLPRTAEQYYLQDHAQRLHNEIETTTRQLELEKRRLNRLEEEVARVRHEHAEKVLKIPSSKRRQKAETEGIAAKGGGTRTIRSLEQCLEKLHSKLNALLHDNLSVRGKIDAARRERLQINQVFKKLQSDIKSNISHTTMMHKDISGLNREEEERNHKISALNKQMDLERRQFHEMKKDLREKEKRDLLNRVSMVRESTDRMDDRTKPLKADEEENFNSTGVMRRIFKLAFLNTIQRRHIRQHQKNIEVFEQAFSTIKSTTGISDIEEIVKIFVVLEQRNFSLLTYVNELNSSIESFDKHNRELANQLQAKRQHDANSDAKKEEMLVEIKQQIESTIRGTKENQDEVKAHSEILERCKPMIRSILKVVEKENCGFGGQAAPTFTGVSENLLEGLAYVEKTLTQWRDYLPESRDAPTKGPGKNYRFTVGAMGMQTYSPPATLVKANDLPSAANIAMDAGTEKRPVLQNREEDSSDEEEDLQSHPWTRQELRDKAVAAVARRRRFRKQEMPGQQQQQKQPEQLRSEADPAAASAVTGVRGNAEASLDATGEVREEDGSDFGEETMPSDLELEDLFLKEYSMTKEELLEHCERMSITLSNLCYLKQEFAACGGDKDGYIDVRELRSLLHRLGEEVTNDELDHALVDLDSSGSGEIEFFAFVEWFISDAEGRAGPSAAGTDNPSSSTSAAALARRRVPGSNNGRA